MTVHQSCFNLMLICMCSQQLKLNFPGRQTKKSTSSKKSGITDDQQRREGRNKCPFSLFPVAVLMLRLKKYKFFIQTYSLRYFLYFVKLYSYDSFVKPMKPYPISSQATKHASLEKKNNVLSDCPASLLVKNYLLRLYLIHSVL